MLGTLKPCPFCGNSPSFECSRVFWDKNNYRYYWVSVKCVACGANITGGTTYDEEYEESKAAARAFAKWNSRVNTDKGEKEC